MIGHWLGAGSRVEVGVRTSAAPPSHLRLAAVREHGKDHGNGAARVTHCPFARRGSGEVQQRAAALRLQGGLRWEGTHRGEGRRGEGLHGEHMHLRQRGDGGAAELLQARGVGMQPHGAEQGAGAARLAHRRARCRLHSQHGKRAAALQGDRRHRAVGLESADDGEGAARLADALLVLGRVRCEEGERLARVRLQLRIRRMGFHGQEHIGRTAIVPRRFLRRLRLAYEASRQRRRR